MSPLHLSHEIQATRAIMERVQSTPEEYSVLVPAGNDAAHYGSSMDVQWAHFGLTPNVVFSIFNGLSVIETIKNCDRILLTLDTRSEERSVGKECVSTGRSRGWPNNKTKKQK